MSVICTECGEAFANIQGLAGHTRWHHPNQNDDTPKEFKCDICPKSFPTQQGLSVHKMRMHDPKGKFKENVRAAIENDADDDYNCNICPKSFKTERGLKIHISNAHRNNSRTVRETSMIQSAATLSYCPCCGVNLSKINLAIAAIEGLRND